jgi:hypothetical protein
MATKVYPRTLRKTSCDNLLISISAFQDFSFSAFCLQMTSAKVRSIFRKYQMPLTQGTTVIKAETLKAES